MPLSMMKTGEPGIIKKVGGKEETRRFFYTAYSFVKNYKKYLDSNQEAIKKYWNK